MFPVSSERRSRVAVVALVGAIASGVAGALGWPVFFGLASGMGRVAVWYLGQLTLPLLGVLTLVFAGLAAVLGPRVRWMAGGAAVVGVLEVVVPSLLLLGLWTPRYPGSALDDTEPAATVRLPLDGPIRVGWGGDTVATNYHAAHPDQRWAYDLLVEPAGLGVGDLEAYGCYGLPVRAPAAAVVERVHDGEPDQDPSAFVPNFEAPAGNFVSLELEGGTFLVIAHLIPGSLQVAAGDRVVEGQELGRCGNSGNTSEPHVHLHHQRQPPEQIGFAEGLPLYFRDHEGAPMPLGGVAVDGDTVRFTGDVVRHQGR